MGIKHEIEQLRLEAKAYADKETRQRERLIREIKAADERLRAVAREFAAPYSQKLEESGAIEALDELREVEDLRASTGEWRWGAFGRLYHNKDSKPAILKVHCNVEIGNLFYSFSGFYLETVSGPRLPLNGTALDELREYYNEIISNGDSDCKMKECFAELVWNHECRNLPSDDAHYNHLVFSLNCRNGLYMLALEGGNSFPESSWGKKRLEPAVARAYLSGDTEVIIYGKPDMY